MLQLIRDRAQGVFAWIIVGLIIIPFALWGLNEYVGGGSSPPVATVNGDAIAQVELENAYYRQRQRLQQMFGEQLPANLFDENQMRQQLLSQLIEDRVVLQQSRDQMMYISNEQLVQVIHSVPLFQQDGRFSMEAYQRALSMQGMQPASFEDQLRRDLLLQQYRGSIEGSEFVTAQEVSYFKRLQNQTRHIGYTLVKGERFTPSITVSDAAIEAEYQNNSAAYQTPETLKIAYLELDQQQIAAAVTIEESELRERYDAQIVNYRTADERHASHILFEVASDADAAAVEAQAIAVRDRIEKGEAFATLAKSISQDPGSASQGGDLGFFGRGVMDEAFEETAFNLEVNGVSQPVRSSFGYHLIKLHEKRGGETKPFDAVREQILRELQSERAEQLLFDRAESLANLTFENPDSLAPAAKALGLTIAYSDALTRDGGSGIASDSKVVEAAFSDDVLLRGNNSTLLELTPSHLVVLRLHEHTPAGVRPLAEVKETIHQRLVQQQAQAQAKMVATDLLKQLEGSSDAPEAVMAAQQQSWQQQERLGRLDSELDRELVNAIFRMPHPEGDKVVYQQVELKNGDQAIVALYQVNVAAEEVAGSEPVTTEPQLQEQLLQNHTNAALEAVIGASLKASKIERKL
ncbi:MAG: SurA N-terminal domain-containing protein [Gammaproteobacteria bacterium]|nr:SurA N-terminal domain-containing protein [Gammaproteobacteria bacterium]